MLYITLSSLSLFLIRTPEQCPSVVSLLSESYNPHVRYGAAMALGICCAGTGNKVKPSASGTSAFLAPDCFPSQRSLCNSCKNTDVVWSRRLNLPHRASQNFLALLCWTAQSRLRANYHFMWVAVMKKNAFDFF